MRGAVLPYVLVAQGMGAGPDVVMSVADAPEGPWEQVHVAYTAPEPAATGGRQFTYNAKAHPEFSDGESVLVTYNVNTTSFAELYNDVDVYRPRFVELALP